MDPKFRWRMIIRGLHSIARIWTTTRGILRKGRLWKVAKANEDFRGWFPIKQVCEAEIGTRGIISETDLGPVDDTVISSAV
jgi:hypothetical protein